jgi:sulfate adenylyltransferase
MLAKANVEERKFVICALVSPYRCTRNKAKELIGADRFVEVFIDTPLDVCEKRDTKGLYGRFRHGDLIGLTGLDDPYEPPLSPDLTLSTCNRSVEENVRDVIHLLISRNLL